MYSRVFDLKNSHAMGPTPSWSILIKRLAPPAKVNGSSICAAGQALQKTLSKSPAEYLIVSHGGILNMVVYTILGIIPQANSQGARFPFDNTSYATFTYQPDKHIWTMVNFIHPTDVTD